MTYSVRPIKDPTPVWGTIKAFLVDDIGELESKGQFVGVFDGNHMVGAFMIKPWNTHTYEVHGGVRQECWGDGLKICREFGSYLYHCTPCLKVIAYVPAYNRLMARVLRLIGMKREGTITEAFMKRYKMHDLHLYGITRGEASRCRLLQ